MSNKEQLSCVLKYETQKIHEELLEFRSLVLLRSYMRGQRRAARPGDQKDTRPNILWCVNVAGKTNGVAALVQVNNHKSSVNSRVCNVFFTKVYKMIA